MHLPLLLFQPRALHCHLFVAGWSRHVYLFHPLQCRAECSINLLKSQCSQNLETSALSTTCWAFEANLLLSFLWMLTLSITCTGRLIFSPSGHLPITLLLNGISACGFNWCMDKYPAFYTTFTYKILFKLFQLSACTCTSQIGNNCKDIFKW